jgi:hypothetical protein
LLTQHAEMVMGSRQLEVEAFFTEYARCSNDALREPPREDVSRTAAAFAPFFVEANPHGVSGGANNEAFRALIPQGYAHYRRIGGKGMQVIGVEVTEFDDHNAMARVDWRFAYERPVDRRRGEIVFHNIYFLNFAAGQPKIFAYITPDEERAMRDHGLV